MYVTLSVLALFHPPRGIDRLVDLLFKLLQPVGCRPGTALIVYNRLCYPARTDGHDCRRCIRPDRLAVDSIAIPVTRLQLKEPQRRCFVQELSHDLAPDRRLGEAGPANVMAAIKDDRSVRKNDHVVNSAAPLAGAALQHDQSVG